MGKESTAGNHFHCSRKNNEQMNKENITTHSIIFNGGIIRTGFKLG